MIKNILRKNLWWLNKIINTFRTLLNVRFVINNPYVDGDVQIRDHCHITGTYWYFSHRDCDIKIKSNHTIPIIFRNLKNFDLHLIMQELGKLNFKTSVTLNELEKYMSPNVNNKLIFTDSFRYLSSSLNILVKNLRKDDLSIWAKNLLLRC